MSNEMAPKSLKHKDDRHIQTRLDYMLLFRSEGKAKIIRTLESWTDTKYAEWFKGIADSKEQKSEPPVEDLWVTMSYDQFSMFVYGTIKHDTIKQQVDELVASKHIQRRVHPVFPYGPPQYLLNRELIQKSLDELEIPGNLFDLAPLLVSPRKKPTPPETYPQGRGKKQGGDPGKIPPPTGESSYPSNNSTKNTDNPAKNEGTYSERESETPTIGADAPVPTPVSHSQVSPDEGRALEATSYQPDTTSSDSQTVQEDTSHGSAVSIGNHLHRDTPSHPVGTGEHTQSPARHTEHDVRLPAAGTDQAASARRTANSIEPARTESTGNGVTAPAEKPAQATLTALASQPLRATSQASAPRRSARQAPAFSPAPLFAPAKPARPTLTEGGKLVRDWYQLIRACRVRLTDDNINACNGLSEEDGISFEALKEVIEYWDADKYVKDHEIPIDLQKLEDPKGAFTFAKAMLILRKRKKPASTAPKPEMTVIEQLRAQQLRYTQGGVQA